MREDRKAPGMDDADRAIEELRVLVTAEEAFPALERAFVEARDRITAGFRILDTRTRLRSEEARALGETWADLIVAVLNRGVSLRLVVSDFDPVATPQLHRRAWRTALEMAALRKRLDDPGRLEFRVAMHPARAGIVPRAVFYPVVRGKLKVIGRDWQAMAGAERAQFRAETPGLRGICIEDEAGRLCFPARLVDLHPATHHQKMAVIDGRLAYIGGLDLDERRYDTKRHAQAAESTWQDVQLMVTGPVVRAAERHLDTFLASVAGAAPPPPAAPGFLRTLSRRRERAPLHISPRPLLREIEAAHMAAIGRARQLVYLETQYLRHVPLARALARRARDCPELRLIVVLPAAPDDIAFEGSGSMDARFGEHQQLRCLTILQRGFGRGRMLVASPVQPRRSRSDGRDALARAPLVYVHSKVSIFDGFGAIVSSANLNGRSLCWDTETGLHLSRPEHVTELRRRVMGHWLPASAGADFLDPGQAFGHWRRLVESNTALPPEAREGFLVRYDSDAAREMAAPAPGLPEELV